MATSKPNDVEEEDDYLTMSFTEPENDFKKETLTQKKKRLAREAEERARPKSKAQIAEEERAKRDAALNTASIDKSSKGFKMMAALGYKTGTALGKDTKTNDSDAPDTRLLEPIGVDMKEGRSGIGADAEKKRKFREEVERKQDSEKRQKVDALEFRERQQKEREEKRAEGQFYGAMKVAEGLDDQMTVGEDKKQPQNRPLSSYHILWRGLVKRRMLADRDRRMRHDLDHSLSRLPTYDDPDEDKDDKIALSRKAHIEEVDMELDQDDEELETFEALPASEKLEQIVSYLRDKWHYCFWCKSQYPDDAMEGCPGLTEEEHD